MNKKAIWMIIGLMGAALIGIVLLQMYWIRWSIQLNQQQFDKEVFSALNRVSEKLQDAENVRINLEVFNYTNAYPSAVVREEFYQKMESENGHMTVELSASNGFSLDSVMKENLLTHLANNEEQECNCINCQRERFERYEAQEKHRQKLLFNKLINPEPITRRIDLKYLHEAIKQELATRGIDIHYNYGVFAEVEQSFVITNGHYVVSDNKPGLVQAGWKNLFNSHYKVNLFPNDMAPPGFLMIHFPSKVSLVWGSVWKTVLASIIFTGIILFCFAYTIQVIFLQKKVSEMKTDFINNMTHEFKTPIATISLAADSITSPKVISNEDKIQRFAGIIKQENKRMNSQVEKVLQMAQIDKKDFQLKLTDVNLHDVINKAVTNANLQVESKGGNVTADLQAKQPIVEGDMTHLTNIIHNLLDNANKYSPKEPEISIHTRNVANGVEVVVSDKGVGMSKEALKHIFDKFYRVHTGDLHDVKGFGLGLSYVKALMTAHKGQIDVKSELGKGSSFILIFPYKVKPQ